jgi:hypothetical protein
MIKVYKDGKYDSMYNTKKEAYEYLGISSYTLNIYLSTGESFDGYMVKTDDKPQRIMIFYKGKKVKVVKSVLDAEKETGIKVYRIRNLINVGDEYKDYSFDYA